MHVSLLDSFLLVAHYRETDTGIVIFSKRQYLTRKWLLWILKCESYACKRGTKQKLKPRIDQCTVLIDTYKLGTCFDLTQVSFIFL